MSSSALPFLSLPFPPPLAIVANAINHLLRQEPWASEQLVKHAGKTIEFVLSPLTVRLALGDDGRVHPTTNGVAAVRIELPLTSLPQVLAGGPRAAMRSVKLDGDAEFAQVVLEVAQNLKWEFEEDLSLWIGDILAHRVTVSARRLADGAQRAHRNVAQSVAEYLTDEQEELVRTRDVETLGVAVRTLRDDVARLDKRLDRLAQN